MSTLLPTAADTAVSNIKVINKTLIPFLTNNITRLDNALNKSVGDDKQTIAAADIIAAAGGDLDTLAAFITALKAAVNIAVPGTYTE
ncbi:MAG: hypothetical protein ACFUZC_16620 [Chthoniobacteraceae bacterium]